MHDIKWKLSLEKRMCRYRLLFVSWMSGINTLKGNKSTKECVAKFDEFLVRCNTLNTEGYAQILSKFRAWFRGNLQTELLAKGVTKLKPAKLKAGYALVQNLDSLSSSYNTRSFDLKSSVFRTSSSSQFNKHNTQTPHIGIISRARVLKGKTKAKTPSFLIFHNQMLQMSNLWTISYQLS